MSPAAGAVPPQFAPSLHVVPSPAPDHVTVAAKRLPAANGDKTNAPTIPIAAPYIADLFISWSSLNSHGPPAFNPYRMNTAEPDGGGAV